MLVCARDVCSGHIRTAPLGPYFLPEHWTHRTSRVPKELWYLSFLFPVRAPELFSGPRSVQRLQSLGVLLSGSDTNCVERPGLGQPGKSRSGGGDLLFGPREIHRYLAARVAAAGRRSGGGGLVYVGVVARKLAICNIEHGPWP